MIIVTSVAGAVGVMMAGILLLGLWTVVWATAEARGRRPAHIFLDYAATYLAVATTAALTLGQLGPASAAEPRFTDQLQQPNGPVVAFALAAGVCVALGDLAMQYATAILGLTIGPALLNALTVIVGVILAYFLDHGINKPSLVFPGMSFSALAIGLGAAAHALNQRHQRKQQKQLPPTQQAGVGCHDSCGPEDNSGMADATCHVPSGHECSWDIEQPAKARNPSIPLVTADGSAEAATAAASSSADQLSRQSQRSIQLDHGTSSWLGLGIAFAGGIAYGLLLPSFQVAANDPFSLLRDGTPALTVYCAFFYVAIGLAVSSAAVNVWFLYRPSLGVESSSIMAYLRDNGSGRWLSILSGVLAALGDLAQFMGGQVAGYAATYLVIAYPIVSALFGMLRFRELQRGSRRALVCAVGQIACYAVSVGLLAASAGLRVSRS